MTHAPRLAPRTFRSPIARGLGAARAVLTTWPRLAENRPIRAYQVTRERRRPTSMKQAEALMTPMRLARTSHAGRALNGNTSQRRAVLPARQRSAERAQTRRELRLSRNTNGAY